MKNKILIMILVLTALFSITVFANTAYQKIDSQTIAQGIKLNKVSQFTSSGWIYLDVIEIDLNNSNVELKPLTSSLGVSHFTSIKTMVEQEGAVVGLNADYFARRPNTTNRGQSIGFLGNNGNILTSSADENISDNVMGSFILNKSSDIIYTYLSNKITVTCPKTKETFVASGINKYVPYNGLCIYTKDWSEKSIGNSEGNWLVELVVIDGEITQIRENMEPVTIPEDGYIVSAFGQIPIDYVLNNFSVGDEIEYSIDLNLDLDKMDFAISGGTILVRDGDVVPFTHTIWGTNEMSAIGSSKDEETVYLIACKNVNNSNSGISQKAFAQAISDYGIYTALCLDGGGSTTLVAKEFGNDYPTTILTRSSYLRPVVNGVGVFSDTSKTTKVGGIILELENDYVFKNNSINLKATVYDTHYNVMDVDLDDISFSISNSNAKYSNGELTGQKEGTCTITAKYKGATRKLEFTVLGDIYSLEIFPKEIGIKEKDSTTFSLTATDKNGYSQKIDNDTVNWFIDGYGEIDNGTFTATKPGATIVCASISNVKTYSLIHTNIETVDVFDDFEELNGTYSGYPAELLGSIELSDKEKYGDYSVRLNYDFESSEQRIRGSYYDYETPLVLPDMITNIGIWVYNPEKNTNSLKSQYLDYRGIKYIDVLAEQLDWKGWKYIEYPSSEKVKEIISIYVAQSDEETSNEGYICLDNLTVTYFGNSDTGVILPEDICKKDEKNKNVSDGFCISLVEEFQNTKTLFTRMKNARMVKSFNKSSDLVLFANTSTNEEYKNQLTCTNKVFSGYTSTKINGCTVITVSASNNGIRKTDFNQWKELINTLDNNSGDILLILNRSIYSFEDTEETTLLLNVLSEYVNNEDSNCWIVQKGNETSNTNINGVKVLTIGNDEISPRDMEKNMEDYSYINIYVTKNNLNYEIKNVF